MLYRDEKYQAAKRLLEAQANFTAARCLHEAAWLYYTDMRPYPTLCGAAADVCRELAVLRHNAWDAARHAYYQFRCIGHYTAGRPDEEWIALAQRIVTRYEKKGKTS